jgi:hypothetical protein
MPESVGDRPTNSWEPIFLLAKSAKYFYDAEAVKEEGEIPAGTKGGKASAERHGERGVNSRPIEYATYTGMRNQRNVWHLGPEPYPHAHFATFPSEIPRRAILAGTSEKGCCPQCRTPWVRVVESKEYGALGPEQVGHDADIVGMRRNKLGGQKEWDNYVPPRTLGWEPGCPCAAGDPVPCLVLDPFLGSGTTAAVAIELGRDAVGCELNPAYRDLARQRIGAVAPLLAREEAV